MADQHAGAARLNGWKEIAACLGKGTRTAQRWERDYALPVHRLTGTGGGDIVYAFRSEIERWRTTSESEAAWDEAPEDGNGGASSDGNGLGDGHPSSSNGNHPPADDSTKAPAVRRPWIRAAVLTGAGALVLWAALFSVRALQAGQPASWRVERDSLVVSDANGRRLWTYVFEFPLDSTAYESEGTRSSASPSLKTTQIVDIDGDGANEVVFLALRGAGSPAINSRLYCFNQDGTVRFRHQPTQTVSFGGERYYPPYVPSPSTFRVTSDGRTSSIWVTFTHHEWFPSVLQRIGPSGNVMAEYWSDGHISALEIAIIGGRRSVFVGAANNDTHGASLAVFPYDQVGGSAPATQPHYQCTSCGPAHPSLFLLFPATDVRMVEGTYSTVRFIHVQNDQEYFVTVGHDSVAAPQGGSMLLGDAIYTVGASGRVTHAEYYSQYRMVHDIFFRTGQIDHAFDQARDNAQLFPVRVWNGTDLVRVFNPEAPALRDRELANSRGNRPTDLPHIPQ